MRITLPAGKTPSDIKVVRLYSDNNTGLVAGNLVNVDTKYPDYFVAQDPVAWSSVTEYTYKPYTFQHSSGYAYNYAPEGLKDGRQQVTQWTYQYYVKPGEKRKLIVPIASHDGAIGATEPNGYWRWYDNATDRACTYISTTNNTGYQLEEPCYDDHDQSYGLFKYQFSDEKWATVENVASVMFNTPTSGWTGSDIACDVSRYKDYPGTDPDVKYEPTLSLRYLFKVRPATDIADNIKKALMSGTAYEDNGHITLGLYNGHKGNITLRTAISDLSMYYFYPYTNTDFAAPAQESHFGTTLCQGKTVTWTVIKRIGTKYYYHILKIPKEPRPCSKADMTSIST